MFWIQNVNTECNQISLNLFSEGILYLKNCCEITETINFHWTCHIRHYWWHKNHQHQLSIKPKMSYLQIIRGFNDWIAVKTGFLLVSWEMVKLVGYYNIGNFMNSFEDLTIRIIHIQNLLKWFIFPIFWISSCQMRKF